MEAANIGTALEVKDLSVATPGGKTLLHRMSFSVNRGEFVAIIGPSGCGKSTLVRALAAQHLSSGQQQAGGYLPQRSTLHEHLAVREILDFSLRLRTALPPAERLQRAAALSKLCGASALWNQRAGSLSGGQQRRVALAELLASDPPILILDELTSGLDPHADREIMQVLQTLAAQARKTILLVTHSVRNLGLCDKILMLKAGRLVYDGPPEDLLSSADAEDIEDLYALPVESHRDQAAQIPPEATVSRGIHENPPPGNLHRPDLLRQMAGMTIRQWLLFVRDRGQMLLHLALAATFPLLVVLFATDGLPLVQSLSLDLLGSNPAEMVAQQIEWKESSFRAGSLVSGLAMFQVILLTLIGANNGAREVAREREINLKELAAGVSPLAYVLQKALYVAILSLAQGAWMAWLVSTVCGFPGSFGEKAGILILTTFAVSCLCLAISAASPSPERASLLSLYLVGFQLPLSGAVLALPEAVRWICQPFISAYWGWSGFLRSFVNSTYYDVVSQITNTHVAEASLCLVVLSLHAVAGLVAAWAILGKSLRTNN